MFVSSNYAQLRCLECGRVTHIMPDDKFDKIECECKSFDLSNMPLDELRVYGRDKKVRSAMQMSREKLLQKLGELNE